MGGKAKFQKHTAKEINAKHGAHKNKGGGSEGAKKRLDATKRLSFVCDICKSASPDIKSFETHFESKHPKAPFDKEAILAKAQAVKDEAKVAQKPTHHKK